MASIFRSLSTLSLLAGLTIACSGKSDGSGINEREGNGSGAASAGGGVMLGTGADSGLGTAGSGSGVIIDPSMACATGTASAALSGVNMFVMFDRSSSMTDPANEDGATRWQLTSSALSAFFASPDAAGLQLALRFFPHDTPARGCTQDDCNVAACSAPLVELGMLTADSAPADSHERALVEATAMSAPGMSGQGTPISAALGGALEWAAAQRMKTPDENSVVVLVTDGQANGCDENIGRISRLAAQALAASGIRTYAIGLTGSEEADMDRIAMAGGTTQGIFVSDGANTQQALLDALGAIRGQVLDCDFPVPQPKPGVDVNLNQINVNFTASSGAQVTIGQVANAAACTGTIGWYYDDPAAPQRIILCPGSCDSVTSDPMTKLDILLGCATVSQIPK